MDRSFDGELIGYLNKQLYIQTHTTAYLLNMRGIANTETVINKSNLDRLLWSHSNPFYSNLPTSLKLDDFCRYRQEHHLPIIQSKLFESLFSHLKHLSCHSDVYLPYIPINLLFNRNSIRNSDNNADNSIERLHFSFNMTMFNEYSVWPNVETFGDKFSSNYNSSNMDNIRGVNKLSIDCTTELSPRLLRIYRAHGKGDHHTKFESKVIQKLLLMLHNLYETLNINGYLIILPTMMNYAPYFIPI